MAEIMVKYPGVNYRPHAKVHKSPDLGQLQIRHGASGLCCQTVREAEAMAEGGIQDIFIFNQVVERPKLLRVASLAKSATISLCVESEKNIKELNSAAVEFGVNLDLVIEVNVGQERSSVEPGEDVVRLAQKIQTLSNVNFKGLQCYNGWNQYIREEAKRKAAVAIVVEKTKKALQILENNGIVCNYITGGGTGTFELEAASGVFTEVQPPGKRAVLNAGLKSVNLNSFVPKIYGRRDLTFSSGGDEHGIVRPSGDLKVGDQVWLIPGHCDPTVHMHSWLVGVRAGVVESLWPFIGR